MIMMVVVLAGILIAKVYYTKINKSVDPRIKPARELYGQYNSLAQDNNFRAIFSLLDSVESVYGRIPHYNDSFEMGVLWNNRAAAWLTIAMYRDSIQGSGSNDYSNLGIDSLLELARVSAGKSIEIYRDWLSWYEGKNSDEISRMIRDEFLIGLDGTKEELSGYLKARVKEIEDAQWETNRRLSVAYTNLGIIFRLEDKLEEAAKMYATALELWEDNLSAENNLNRLLGRPTKKRSIIQKLFPKPREKQKTKTN